MSRALLSPVILTIALGERASVRGTCATRSRIGSPTPRDEEGRAVARGTILDDETEGRTADCTRCTKHDVAGAGAADGHDVESDLPDPEPELFLLAGVTAASACPGEARAVRARAGLPLAARTTTASFR